MKYIVERFKERSTYATIFAILLNVFGVSVMPDLQDCITDATVSILALIGLLTQEVR